MSQDFNKQIETAGDRVAELQLAGRPACQFPWEAVCPWDPCENVRDTAMSVPKRLDCGHMICDHHRIMHKLLTCVDKNLLDLIMKIYKESESK